MVHYLIKRFFSAIATLVLVVVIITSIIYLAPVDPARLTFGQRSDVESIEAKRRALGLDRPLYIQLAAYLHDISPISVHRDVDTIAYKVRTERLLTDTMYFSAKGNSNVPDTFMVFETPFATPDSFRTVAQKMLSKKANTVDSLYLGAIFSYRDTVVGQEFWTIDNRVQYNYTKLLPLGEKWLVFKRPYLRESYQTGRPVWDILVEVVPRTAILALVSILLAGVLGIFLGVLAALKQNTWFDNSSVFMSVLGYSLPSYITAILLAYIFGYLLADYTGLNVRGSLTDVDSLTGETFIVWKNLLLPAIALGIRPVAIITQLTRSSMLDVLSQDYVRTARAKGLKERVVIFRHALRNALNPVVTAISGWFAALLAGAFFVENVFSYNGLGYQTVQALLNFDVPVVLGAVLFTACVFVLINTLVDFIYAWLDPRVTVGK